MLWQPALIVLTIHAFQQPARPAAPDTEIFLLPLRIEGDRVELGTATNISNSPGYDNQPSFTPDGSAILFTSARKNGQTDIYRYDLASKRTVQITDTPESEYSPTIAPDGRLSVIRVEADGTQRLWTFTADGADPRVLLASIKPVGYHAWAGGRTLVLYVLGAAGSTDPSTLQIADVTAGTAKVVAHDVGRSVLSIPGGEHVSFIQRQSTGPTTSLTFKELDPAMGDIQTLTSAPAGSTEAYGAWTRDGVLATVKDDHLYLWRRGQSGWRDFSDLIQLGLHGVTRLAISPDTKWLAVVGTP
jgi:WD40 repeat protein